MKQMKEKEQRERREERALLVKKMLVIPPRKDTKVLRPEKRGKQMKRKLFVTRERKKIPSLLQWCGNFLNYSSFAAAIFKVHIELETFRQR